MILPEANNETFSKGFILNNVTGGEQERQRLQDLHILDGRLHQHPEEFLDFGEPYIFSKIAYNF
jgi:hypothetical protein